MANSESRKRRYVLTSKAMSSSSRNDDKIVWKWTTNGQYTSKSAYRTQFLGSYRRFCTNNIWKAKTEKKCKLFAWILIQNKILTADNLQSRGWPHNDACALCHGPLETCYHLCLACPFAEAVWSHITSSEHFTEIDVTQQANFNTLADWWDHSLRLIPKERKRAFNGLAIYTMWNLWKERNRRIF